MTSEDELVRRAQAGNIDAFEQLVLMHQQFVFNLALRTVSDPHEAQDLAQEVFLRAWQALPRFKRQSRFRTWLYRIVVNLCYNRLPRLRQDLLAAGLDDPESPALELVASGAVDPQENLERQARMGFIQQQVQALPEGYRLMVLLRFVRECSYDEIAEIMDLPLGTVKTGLFRARRLLRAALSEYEQSPKELLV